MEHPAYSQLRQVTPDAGVVLCPNPAYETLEGTNAWVIRAEGDPRSIVVDPGPEDEGHLNVLNNNATEIALILLTHRRDPVAGGAERLSQITGAPVRSMNPNLCRQAEPLEPGEVISVDGVSPTLQVMTTPGLTQYSTSFIVRSPGGENEAVLTGGTIVGRHTSMISETDGNLGLYIESLERLKAECAGLPMLPAHGPDHEDVIPFVTKYLDRRHLRLQQVRDAREKLGQDATVTELVDEIYTDVDPVLRGAAEQSTRVALRYLDEQE